MKLLFFRRYSFFVSGNYDRNNPFLKRINSFCKTNHFVIFKHFLKNRFTEIKLLSRYYNLTNFIPKLASAKILKQKN